MHGQSSPVPSGDFVNAIVAEALQHVRDGQARRAIETLTSRGEAALNSAFVCNLLGLLYTTEGRDEKALDCFDRTLRIGPGSADILGNRALVLQRLGRLDAAIAGYDDGLRFRPDDPQMLHGRATALHRAGRLEEALACYDAVLRILPTHADALAHRGGVLQELGRLTEALDAYESALRQTPRDETILFNHGNVLRALGRPPTQALASYQAALRVEPAHVGALCGCAKTLQEMSAFEDALAYCDKALHHAPDSFHVRLLLANVLCSAGKTEDALQAYDAALDIEPRNLMALCNRAAALCDLNRLEAALAACDEVIGLAPDLPQAWTNRGICLLRLYRLEDALEAFGTALALQPDYPEAASNRGIVLRELGRFDEALAAFDASLALRPQFPHALNNKSVTLLLLGDFENGWKGYGGHVAGATAGGVPSRRIWPEWPGLPASPEGLRLLVVDEHGLGDSIQFGRYLPILREAGAQVTVLCRKPMHRLLQPLFEGLRVIDRLDGDEQFDYRIGLAGLPRAFLATPETIPTDIPYLRAEPPLVAKWSEVLGEHGFKIGIGWQCNTDIRAEDTARAIPLHCFAPLAALPGVRLISLQRSAGVAQLAQLPAAMKVETLADFDSAGDAFIDTAAVMQSLDLVITCDTSLAHLAGALGRPVWVALRSVPEWRWLLGREDMPWYPNMRLFRQVERGDWEAVFDRIAAALEITMQAGVRNSAS